MHIIRVHAPLLFFQLSVYMALCSGPTCNLYIKHYMCICFKSVILCDNLSKITYTAHLCRSCCACMSQACSSSPLCIGICQVGLSSDRNQSIYFWNTFQNTNCNLFTSHIPGFSGGHGKNCYLHNEYLCLIFLLTAISKLCIRSSCFCSAYWALYSMWHHVHLGQL